MSDQHTLYTNPEALAKSLIATLTEMGYLGQAPEKSLWTKAECAAYMQCSTTHLDVLICNKQFPVIDISKPGSKSKDLRFSPEAVKVWAMGQK